MVPRGIDHGAFKLDHLQPVKLISYQKISASLTFILGSPIIYYPRRQASVKMQRLSYPIRSLGKEESYHSKTLSENH